MAWERGAGGQGGIGRGKRETCPSRVWLPNDPRDRARVAFSPFARPSRGQSSQLTLSSAQRGQREERETFRVCKHRACVHLVAAGFST